MRMEILSTGEKIKRTRIYKGYTLREICDDKISVSKMSCIENDKIAPEDWVLEYLAEKLDLYRDIQFNTTVESAEYHEDTNRWNITIDSGETISSHFFITAVGAISAANVPIFKGLDNFKGEWYHTGKWPHEKVDFSGKHVGIIGSKYSA